MKTQLAFSHLVKVYAFASLLLVVHSARSAMQIVTQLPPGAAVASVGGGYSYDPILTPDGRFVLFASSSANLVTVPLGPDHFPAPVNVYLRDRQTGATMLVSVNEAGTGGGNGDSFPNAISSNGRFAVFESAASDLVADDTNGVTDIFVRDVVNNTTTLVSVSTNGSVGNGISRDAAMTPDGRYVAFVSAANNLVADDTNGIPDIFVRDLQLGLTTLASPGAQKYTGSLGTPLTPGSSSEGPVLSADGRYVAFYSTAVGLAAGAANPGQLYLRDLTQGSTLWVSTNAYIIGPNPSSTNYAAAVNYAMSTNGQWIAYLTTGLLAGEEFGAVYRYNAGSGVTQTIATNGAFIITLEREARALDMSADGRFVAFTLTNSAGGASIQLWDGDSGTTSLMSGTNQNALCEFPRVDQTGRYVAFSSDDASLTPNSDGQWHIYLRDSTTNATQLVDVGPNGHSPISSVTTPFHLSADGGTVAFACADGALSMNPYMFDAFARNLSMNTTEIISSPAPTMPSATPLNSSGFNAACVSSNGQYVAFVSLADGLVGGDTNGCEDVYVHDLFSGSNTLVSVSAFGPYSGNGNAVEPAISADGRYVVFSSYATNLVVTDTNKACDDFRRDILTGSTALVSVDATGAGEGNGNSTMPQLSADGQRVLFLSMANNLTTDSVSNGPNLFWRDMRAGVTYALTVGGATAGNPFAAPTAAMPHDGSNVLFGISGQFPPDAYLYLWNAQTHNAVTVATLSFSGSAVAISADARRGAFVLWPDVVAEPTYALDLVAQTNMPLLSSAYNSRYQPQFSGDGRFLVYLAANNTNPFYLSTGVNQVCLYDFVSGSNILVSQSYNFSSNVNATCYSPAIDLTGRFVAYHSAATNLVPNDTNGVAGVYLFDRLTGGTTLVSADPFGPATGPSYNPVFSADGHTLFFQSWSANLAPGDFNESADIFALALSPGGSLTNGAPPLTFTGIAWPEAGGLFSTNQPVVLSWPSSPGTGYQVQFKNNLTDPVWQPLDNPATVVGGQGQAMDYAPDPTNRFYRLISF